MSKMNFKDIFKGAFKSLFSRYFMNVIIVFLVGLLVSGYAMTTGFSVPDTNNPASEIMNQASGFGTSGRSNADALNNLIKNLEEKGVINLNFKSEDHQYTRGVFSVFFNEISSGGSFAFGILNGVNTLVFKGSVSRSIVIFVVTVLGLAFAIFVQNIVEVGRARYFLEHRRYSETKADRILFVYKFDRTMNVAKIMLLRDIFQLLWGFTIIGGIIKAYEYSMIPYILAENPDIKWRDAFYLSKNLTKGDKFKIALIDIIYIPGYVISYFCFNLFSIFLMDPLAACTGAEIYMDLRQRKRDLIDRAPELLNDRLLAVANVSASVYPDSAYTLQIHEKRQWMKIDYNRNYTFSTIVLLFFTYAFVGYVWEVFYTLVNEGLLVNRGTMTGPWLPIYGVGGMVIIVLLKPLRRNPFLMFFGTFVACGVLEYFASWLLEVLFNSKWWDYQGYFLNINGRVCLEGLLVFGLAGVAFTYIFSPLLDNLYSKIKMPAKKIICIVLISLFAVDLVYSFFNPNKGDGVTYGEGGMGHDTVVTEVSEESAS